MRKSINAFFLALHVIAACWGISILGPLWFQLDVETIHSTVLLSILVLLPTSCVYLLLMSKSVLGTAVSIACFVSNLMLYGFPALVVLLFRTDYFSLSLCAFSHDLVLISLLIQCYFVIFKRRK